MNENVKGSLSSKLVGGHNTFGCADGTRQSFAGDRIFYVRESVRHFNLTTLGERKHLTMENFHEHQVFLSANEGKEEMTDPLKTNYRETSLAN